MLRSSLQPLSSRRHCQAATSGRQTTRPRDSGTQVLEAKDLPTPDHRLLDLQNYSCTPGTSLRYLLPPTRHRCVAEELSAAVNSTPSPSAPDRARDCTSFVAISALATRLTTTSYHPSNTVHIPHHHPLPQLDFAPPTPVITDRHHTTSWPRRYLLIRT